MFVMEHQAALMQNKKDERTSKSNGFLMLLNSRFYFEMLHLIRKTVSKRSTCYLSIDALTFKMITYVRIIVLQLKHVPWQVVKYLELEELYLQQYGITPAGIKAVAVALKVREMSNIPMHDSY